MDLFLAFLLLFTPQMISGIGEHSGKAYKCDEWPPQGSKSFEAKTSATTTTIQEAPQKPVDRYKELRGRTCGEEGVEAMNKKRAMHVDTDPFKLDPDISRYAQEWAEEVVRKTNGESPYHRQNLLSCTEALSAGNYNITQLIDGIYSKVDEIDWNDIKDVGHITSLLDFTMGYVGIGCSPRNDVEKENFVYVINFRRDLAKFPISDKYPSDQTKVRPPITLKKKELAPMKKEEEEESGEEKKFV